MMFYTSPTTLGMACNRCLFDHVVLKHRRPRGAYPSLPNGIDRTLKAMADQSRTKKHPFFPIQDEDGGYPLTWYPDQEKINRYREWNGLVMKRKYGAHTVILSGGIDDLLMDGFMRVVIADFKTKDKEPQDCYGEKYYKQTLELYALLLRAQGEVVVDHAHLLYYWPDSENVKDSFDSCDSWSCSLSFNHKILSVSLDPEGGSETLNRFGALVAGIPANTKNFRPYRPKPDPECEYCLYTTISERMNQGESNDPF
jgi:hypothetical protein